MKKIIADKKEVLRLLEEGALTYAEIGDLHGVSRQRIHQIAELHLGKRPRWSKPTEEVILSRPQEGSV